MKNQFIKSITKIRKKNRLINNKIKLKSEDINSEPKCPQTLETNRPSWDLENWGIPKDKLKNIKLEEGLKKGYTIESKKEKDILDD